MGSLTFGLSSCPYSPAVVCMYVTLLNDLYKWLDHIHHCSLLRPTIWPVFILVLKTVSIIPHIFSRNSIAPNWNILLRNRIQTFEFSFLNDIWNIDCIRLDVALEMAVSIMFMMELSRENFICRYSHYVTAEEMATRRICLQRDISNQINIQSDD